MWVVAVAGQVGGKRCQRCGVGLARDADGGRQRRVGKVEQPRRRQQAGCGRLCAGAAGHGRRAPRALPTDQVTLLAQRGVRGGDRRAADRQGIRELALAGQGNLQRQPAVHDQQTQPVRQLPEDRATAGRATTQQLAESRCADYPSHEASVPRLALVRQASKGQARAHGLTAAPSALPRARALRCVPGHDGPGRPGARPVGRLPPGRRQADGPEFRDGGDRDRRGGAAAVGAVASAPGGRDGQQCRRPRPGRGSRPGRPGHARQSAGPRCTAGRRHRAERCGHRRLPRSGARTRSP